MEVNVVIKGNEKAKACGTKPGDGIPAGGQEDESHVELEGLGRALGSKQAVAHDLKRGLVFVLEELPEEQTHQDSYPESQNPDPLPVLLQVVEKLGARLPDGAPLSQTLKVLAQRLARVAQRLAVVQVGVLLQKQRLQLP